MNQALSFGLLLAGGVALEAGLTGKGPGAVLKGTAGKVPTSGSSLNITGSTDAAGPASPAAVAGATGVVKNGVAGVGSTIASWFGGKSGTFTPDPGTSYTEGQTPQLAILLQALSAEIGQGVTGISGYRTPAHSVAVGGFADDPHTKGEASDTGLASGPLTFQNVTNAQLAAVGLWRPFDMDGSNPAEADHLQIIPQLGGPTEGSVGGGPPTLSAAAVAKLKSVIGPIDAPLS